MIILYDIPSSLAINAWSVNTWKTRYCLNYKGIPYKTEWIEYPDIEGHSKNLGIPPTGKKDDGSPAYTLPAIHDTSTGAYISDSLVIAEYLEKTYPNTPPLFPHNTEALQVAFTSAFTDNQSAIWSFIVPAVYLKLNPASQEYFRRTRERAFGKKLEDLVPKGEEAVKEWAKYKEGLGKTDAWYAKNGGKGPFLMGETLSWGDIVVVSYTAWLKIIWGEDSAEWRDIESWHGGRWKTLVDSLKKYETII